MTRADAATGAGIHPSSLTRILNDEIQPSPDIVGRLLEVLADKSDRVHCLREYLFDQTPADYRDGLIIHFGQVDDASPPRRPDSLHRALSEIEEAATEDPDLRRLVVDLAKVVGHGPAASVRTPGGEIAACDAALCAAERERNKVPIPRGVKPTAKR